MKAIFTTCLLALAVGCTAYALKSDVNSRAEPAVDSRTPLLVELFTAEGCSSCPPAEALLAKFENEQPFENAELITLAFHVDYWDGLGWKDKYASPLFTQRQRVYDRKFRTGQIYTPQMVIDGDFEFVGSREKDAKKAVSKAAGISKGRMNLSVEGDKIDIAVSGLSGENDSTLYVAVAEDGLGSEVKRGENAGKNLSHLSVVRTLAGVALINAGEKDFESIYNIPQNEEWKREKLKIVVFVQENASRNILAVGQIRPAVEKQ